MVKLIQPNFSGGAVSPAVGARVDISKYKSSVKKAENVTVLPTGGLANRTGFEFVAQAKVQSTTVRLIPFSFNTEQTYMLEFGNLYMRVIKDGGQVLDTSVSDTISGATAANPVVVTATGHSFLDGDDCYISAVVGMTQLNGRTFRVANKAANTFELTDLNGVNIDGTGYTAYSSAGQADKVFEIATPYTSAQLFELKYVQSADVVTVTHKSHAPRDISRLDHDDWTLAVIDFVPTQVYPDNVAVTANSAGSSTDRYVVTAVNRETAEESLRGIGPEIVISGATQADPVVITATAHGFADGDEVWIKEVVGMTELNLERWTVNNVLANSFELRSTIKVDVDGTGFTAYSSAGVVQGAYAKTTVGNATPDNTITWDEAPEAESYSIYKEKNGTFGFIGSTEQLTFDDDNIEADLGDTPPKIRTPFDVATDYPSAVGYYQQRRVFASSTDNPQRIWFTQTANIANLSVSSPAKNGDGITITIASLAVNKIRHFVPLEDLIVLTAGGEWVLNGVDSKLTPDSVQIKPQTYYGSTDVAPIVVGDIVLYIQPGEVIRDLGYEFSTDTFKGSDVSILARHLFEGRTIVDWAFSLAPNSTVWAVRDDGRALVLTYIPDQKIFGWTECTTEGDIKSIASIREGSEDIVYALVERDINGSTVQYIERLHERIYETIQDCFFVDSGLTLDTPLTMTGFTNADPVVITTTNAHGLSNGDTIDLSDIRLVSTAPGDVQGWKLDTDLNGTGYTVANVTSTTFELQNNAVNVDGTAFGVYHSSGNVRASFTTISGLWHLEGEIIGGIANGYVVPDLTVASGQVTLATAASRVHLGKVYQAEVETLRLDTGNANSETIQGKTKKISRLTLDFEKSIGFWYGPDRDHMYEAKFGLPALYGQPEELLTGLKSVTMSPKWTKDARVVIQQRDPLPFTLLAAIPDGIVGGN